MTKSTPIDYATMPERRRLRSLSVIAIIIALIATAASIRLTFADLWSLPPATAFAGIGIAFNVLPIAIATFAVGVTLAMIAVLVGRRDRLSIWLAIVAAAVSLAPGPAAQLTADWIAAKHSLVWGA